jgi:arylsulfatase A-like enzyme
MKLSNIKINPILLLAGSLFFGFSCSEKVEEAKAPNIVLILADDLGIGDIGAFNSEGKIKTPHIDAIANQGIIFTDAHTSSAVCTPTRYGIITGRYNWRSRLKNGVLTGKSKALIPNSRYTIARMLKSQGYNTGFIGKWHLGWDWALIDSIENKGSGWDPIDFAAIDFSKPISNGPKDLGFDYSYGHSGSLDMAPYVYVENGMPTAIPDKVTVDKGKYTWWREGPTSPDFDHHDVTPNFFRKANDFITENANKENPFFLYLPLPSPHTPILPTEEWLGKSGMNPYADFTMMIDHHVGQLTGHLESLGIDEKTMVIFTSDNGCSPQARFNELAEFGHDPSAVYRGHKADIFEGGHRVPFAVKWPVKIKGGSVSDETICTTDFAATFADITNYELDDSEGEDSYSFLSLLTGENETFNRPSIVNHSINGSFAIRKEDYKLIMAPGSGGWSQPAPNNKAAIDTLPPVQLYNLKDDPGEINNIVANNPELLAELTTLLNKYINEGRSTDGVVQENDTGNWWKQLTWIENPNETDNEKTRE